MIWGVMLSVSGAQLSRGQSYTVIKCLNHLTGV